MMAIAPQATRARTPHGRRGSARWRRAIGVVLVVHAIAHLAGTSQAIAAIGNDGHIDAVGGLAELESTGVLGVWATTWALLAAVTALAAAHMLLGRPAARATVIIAASASLVACVVGLWPTTLGVVVNVALLIASRRPIWSTP